MSRPYLKINSATYSYSTDVVTLSLTALRLRGQSSFSVDGFSASRSISLTDGFYENSTYTFSAVLDGSTSSTTTTTTYNASTATVTFAGTASLNANVGFKLPTSGGVAVLGAGGYTFSATQSTAAALNLLVGAMSFSGAAAGFSATTSGNTIVFSAPSNTGVYYNGFSVVVDKQGGLGTFTYSGASFSGGYTSFALALSSTDFGSIETSSFIV